MAMYPDVQEKARAELSAAIGPDRLPEISDMESLPYMNALLKELQRWHPAILVGIPHVSVADDEYRGFFIPAGSTMLPNVW